MQQDAPTEPDDPRGEPADRGSEPDDPWAVPDPRYAERVAALVPPLVEHACKLAEGIDFATFQCAARMPHDLAAADEADQLAFRRTLRPALAAALAERWVDRTATSDTPDVQVEAIPDQRIVALRVRPMFVAGRYRKLARGISQTVFHCRTCRGRRCDECNDTGRLIAESVEDFVRAPIVEQLRGKTSAFHAAGREDIDVRMLGGGRPFVVSVTRPKRRALDLALVAAEAVARSGGRVEVLGLRVVDRATSRGITTARGEKSYRVVVRPVEEDAALPADAAQRVRTLVGVELAQRTPVRVSERRSDQVRRRRVLDLEVESGDDAELVVVVTAEAGTYIKELVSGDEGRTTPSMTEVLGVPVVCSALDVLEVSDQAG